MADVKNWIREAMFYHIYPLGFTGAPLQNEGEATAGGRILEVLDWIEHFKELGIRQSILDRSLNLFPMVMIRQIIIRQTAGWEVKRILRKSLRHYMKTASVLSWMESLIM